jgi:hypothetical protein
MVSPRRKNQGQLCANPVLSPTHEANFARGIRVNAMTTATEAVSRHSGPQACPKVPTAEVDAFAFRPTLTDLNSPTGGPKAVCMSLEVVVIGGGIGGLSAAAPSEGRLDAPASRRCVSPKLAGIQSANAELLAQLGLVAAMDAVGALSGISGAGTMNAAGAARSRGRGALARLTILSPR